MNGLDSFFTLIVVASIVTAAVKGFFYEIWMMAAAIAAILLAAWNYEAAAKWFHWIGVPEAAHFCGFILILVVILIAAAVIGRLIRTAMHAVGLKLPDRLLGAGLGLVRGVLLCMAVLAVMIAYPFQPGLVQQSRLAPDLLWAAAPWCMSSPPNSPPASSKASPPSPPASARCHSGPRLAAKVNAKAYQLDAAELRERQQFVPRS